MRVRIIVLFTDEDDVGAGHVRRHHFEVRKRRTPGVVHALRNVRARNRLRLSPRRQSRQPRQRDPRAGRQYHLHVCCCYFENEHCYLHLPCRHLVRMDVDRLGPVSHLSFVYGSRRCTGTAALARTRKLIISTNTEKPMAK